MSIHEFLGEIPEGEKLVPAASEPGKQEEKMLQFVRGTLARCT